MQTVDIPVGLRIGLSTEKHERHSLYEETDMDV